MRGLDLKAARAAAASAAEAAARPVAQVKQIGVGALAIVSALCDITDAIYNAAFVTNPGAFVFAGSRAQRKDITPSTPQTIYTNKSQHPVLVNIRVETAGAGLTAYLFLSTDDLEEPTQDRAPAIDFGETPMRGLVVPPGKDLVANATSSDASGDPVRIIFTTLPLRGFPSWPTKESR